MCRCRAIVLIKTSTCNYEESFYLKIFSCSCAKWTILQIHFPVLIQKSQFIQPFLVQTVHAHLVYPPHFQTLSHIIQPFTHSPEALHELFWVKSTFLLFGTLNFNSSEQLNQASDDFLSSVPDKDSNWTQKDQYDDDCNKCWSYSFFSIKFCCTNIFFEKQGCCFFYILWSSKFHEC